MVRKEHGRRPMWLDERGQGRVIWDEAEELGKNQMSQGFVGIYPKNNGKPLKNFNQEKYMIGSE